MMLVTIRDDTRNVLNMQHITPNSKRLDYSDIPAGGYKKIKGLGDHLRKAPTPTSLLRSIWMETGGAIMIGNDNDNEKKMFTVSNINLTCRRIIGMVFYFQ